MQDLFGARAQLDTQAGPVNYFRLEKLQEDGLGDIASFPFSLKVLLESLLRNCDNYLVQESDVKTLAGWTPDQAQEEIAFMCARVLLQDFTGVPAVVDLAALRSAMSRLGGDPKKINPLIPVDLVIDHSVQVDRFGSLHALFFNAEREFERNRERYEFLRWGKEAFENFSAVPPATGIVHQVNLEYLAKVIQTKEVDGELVAYPDTLVGTDSHTTMINGLGVVGWGVGGIEAEAAMLGQPIYMLTPQVVGFKLEGGLQEGVTATDLVLRVTEMLREHGVVGKFVEFYGAGLSNLSLADRATIANMSPEYGATIGFFPVDDETLNYLRGTGRDEALIDLVEKYSKAQGLFRTDDTPDPTFNESLGLDMGTVVPSVAGPKRPQDRIPLKATKQAFLKDMKETFNRDVKSDESAEFSEGEKVPVRRDLYQDSSVEIEHNNVKFGIKHSSVVIAAITSCTNTSNPSVMIGAGLLAKKAVKAGLDSKPWVKTSMAPGSKVVKNYLEASELLPYLEALGFHIVGYGCTTCIGNSGPVPERIAQPVNDNDLVVSAVLSGNRNFEGRISPTVRANYLASPPLVVAYALAGTMDIDFDHEPIGEDPNGVPIYLSDIWPTQEEIREEINRSLNPEMFKEQYSNVFDGNQQWNEIDIPKGDLYAWDEHSTYIQEPPFFMDMSPEPEPLSNIQGARVLALLGDSVTTDHISPAGAISKDSPAAKYLLDRSIKPEEFNSYGSRRGNHEVMMRGTFANIRLRNLLAPDTEGGVTIHLPSGEQMSIYDAAMKYIEDGTPLIVLGGIDYGMGSSRDWAAKGSILLGIKAVIAKSFERIHRSNLIGMGVLPMTFKEGEDAESLGLTGHETFSIEGITELKPRAELTVKAVGEDGNEKAFTAIARVDTPVEVDYYRNGGILQTVLRKLMQS